jgi:glycosyltransferase involved in cell wall biosynthesis
MRIALVSANRFLPSIADGASFSAFQLLIMLKALGDDVQSLSFLQDSPWSRRALDALGRTSSGKTRADSSGTERLKRDTVEWPGIEREGVRLRWLLAPAGGGTSSLRKSILDTLRGLDLDAAIVLDDDAPAMLALAELGIPAAHLIFSVANVESLALANPAFTRIMRRGQVYAVSHFLQGIARELLGLETSVLHPCIDFRRYLGRQGRERLVTVGYAGGPGKGDRIVAGIIERLPEVRFLIAGRYSGKDGGPEAPSESSTNLVIHPANVERLGQLNDMRELYDRIDLLLVPSTVEETFGRVILEAAANGIPAIANRVGGITEALGDGGIAIEFERGRDSATDAVERYVRAIRQLRDDASEYAALSRKARARARDYEREQPLHAEALRRALSIKKLKIS